MLNYFYFSYKTATTDADNAKFGTFKESEKYLRDKNFELERYNAELELKLEDKGREAARLLCARGFGEAAAGVYLAHVHHGHAALR